MVRKTSSPLAGHTRIVFELPASLWADQVYVVGDFAHGHPQRLPLTQARDGRWQAVLDLPVGHQYHFGYAVNGAWYADDHADGFALSAEGHPLSRLDLT